MKKQSISLQKGLRFSGLFSLVVFGLGISGLAAAATNSELIRAYCGDHGGQVFQARTTGYFPDNSEMEGGFSDRMGRPLRTLQSYLAGHAEYVSIAMDKNAFPYGTKVFIPGLSNFEHTSSPIQFRVVDTGGAFRGKGTSRVDLCVASEHESLKSEINTTYTMVACDQ